MRTIELGYKASRMAYPKAPYHFDATVFKPSHYPDPVKAYEPGKYWFPLRLGGEICGVKLTNKGATGKPRVQISVFSQRPLAKSRLDEAVAEVQYRFEFDRDILEFVKRFQKDKVLGPFIKRWRGMRTSCAYDLYGLLMVGIFLQNATVRRTVQMTNAMLSRYGTKVKFGGKEMFCFWRPEGMAKAKEAELRGLKVGYRAKLLIKTSESFVKEHVDELALRRLPREEVKKELLKLYGVGPETARILLDECFHSYGAFEHVAPWQQKIYSRLLFQKKLVPARRIIRYIQDNWGEWATLAAHYIWEDIFWQRKRGRRIDWLEKEIRLRRRGKKSVDEMII